MKASLTEGNLWKAMFLFSIPMILTNLFQAVYSIVDMIIVGQFAGPNGLAAVGNGSQITMIILTIVLGMSNGGVVLVAQLLGAKRVKEVERTIGTMVIFFLVLGAVITVVVLCLINPILHLLNTPAEAYQQTANYLRICVIGTIPIYMYNMMAALLRAAGNSGIPLRLVGFSTVLNLVLDLLFVGVFSMSATGAAIATVIAQTLCAVLIFPMTKKKIPFLQVKWKELTFHKDVLKNVVKIGLPQTIQFSLTHLSFAMVMSLVNVYGADAAAVSASVTRLSGFAVLSGQAVMGAVAAMAGQNIGAKNHKRAMKGMLIGMVYGLPLAVVFFILSEIFPETMLRIFTNDPAVLTLGVPYLKVLAISFFIEAIMFTIYGLLIGGGYTNITMLCALLNAFLVRYALALILSKGVGMGLMGIAWAYPFAPAVSIIVCVIFIMTGRWKISRLERMQAAEAN